MSVERDATRRRILIVLVCFGAVILLTNLALVTATDFGLRIEKLPLPTVLGGKAKGENLGLAETVGYGVLFILGRVEGKGPQSTCGDVSSHSDHHDNPMQLRMGFSRRRDPGEACTAQPGSRQHGLCILEWSGVEWIRLAPN